jgi:hypothetical protein
MRIPTSLVVATGLIAGFAVARSTRREIGGALWAAAGAWCAREWWRAGGPVAAVAMSAVYAGAMGGSHPLSKRIGAWPSVLCVTGITAVLSEVVTRRGPR